MKGSAVRIRSSASKQKRFGAALSLFFDRVRRSASSSAGNSLATRGADRGEGSLGVYGIRTATPRAAPHHLRDAGRSATALTSPLSFPRRRSGGASEGGVE